MKKRDHWERIYSSKDASEVSWYQPEATMSLERQGVRVELRL